jgi:hypothetical protein
MEIKRMQPRKSDMRHLRSSILVAVALALSPGASVAGAVKRDAINVVSPLTDDDGVASTNVSGISCLPPAGGKHVCLAIDDQGRLAQAATIEGLQLTARGKIKIFGKAAPPDIVGKKPDVDRCFKGEDKFKDLDGEAVGHDDKNFYVVGSHGCSRTSTKFRASSFILARIPHELVTKAAAADVTTVDEDGAISTTFRLSEALLNALGVKDLFATDLMKDEEHKIAGNGLNIEGLAIAKGKLYAGLRAPILENKAFLVAVDVDRLFDANRPIGEGDVKPIELALGEDRGVRDLAMLSDGRILILSGPTQKGHISYAVHVIDPNDKATLKQIAVLADTPETGTEMKAEAMHVLGQNGTALDLLIMFDGPSGGAPQRYRIED